MLTVFACRWHQAAIVAPTGQRHVPPRDSLDRGHSARLAVKTLVVRGEVAKTAVGTQCSMMLGYGAADGPHRAPSVRPLAPGCGERGLRRVPGRSLVMVFAQHEPRAGPLRMDRVHALVIGGADERLQRFAEGYRMLRTDMQIEGSLRVVAFDQLEMVGYSVP